jgi:hypothetical protein
METFSRPKMLIKKLFTLPSILSFLFIVTCHCYLSFCNFCNLLCFIGTSLVSSECSWIVISSSDTSDKDSRSSFIYHTIVLYRWSNCKILFYLYYRSHVNSCVQYILLPMRCFCNLIYLAKMPFISEERKYHISVLVALLLTYCFSFRSWLPPINICNFNSVFRHTSWFFFFVALN